MTDSRSAVRTQSRSAIWALWGGIGVSLALTALIWWAGGRLASVPHLPDSGASWYYWKLPTPTTLGRLTAWGFYALHQISFWAVIYYAQTRVSKHSAALQPINFVALAMNGFFILLHFLQTHLWYDGLAQDVSIWSSQGSVILMLVLILIMENPRRGMFFTKKAPLPKRVPGLVRKYHGYIIAWATVYTFWYHPMEPTSGHLIGFLYMFLLFLQGSLIFNRLHLHRWWMVTLEVAVLVHGTLVAVMQGGSLWPMFFFGFGGILVITQMHGLRLSRLVRWLILALYVILVLVVYSQRGWVQMNEVIRIPIIEYALAIVLAWLIAAGLWVFERVRRVDGPSEA